MMFIVIFGLLSVLSLGIAAFALENPDIPQRGLPAIVAYNFVLFGFNIGLTIYLYVRTYHLVLQRGFAYYETFTNSPKTSFG